MLNRGCTLFEGSKERSRASIKGRLFESSIGLKGDSMVYFVRGKSCLGLLKGVVPHRVIKRKIMSL